MTAVYDAMHASAEFQELRRRYRSFAIPWTVAFLAWYMLYVIMSNWATDFMDTRVVGNINVALVFGLLQFVSTFLIAWLYARTRPPRPRPAVQQARGAVQQRGRPRHIQRPGVN